MSGKSINFEDSNILIVIRQCPSRLWEKLAI